jgi:hypothetical protein
LGVCAASLALFAWAWAPAFPAGASFADACSLIGGRGAGDDVALVGLRASELARLALGAGALVLWARPTETNASNLTAIVAALLAAAWADAAWGGWPPPQGIVPPLKVMAATALAAAAALAAARRDPRAGWGVVLLLLGGLGQQLARPAVELEALRSLERLALGDLTRSLAPLGACLALALVAAWTRGWLRCAAAASLAALAAGGLWGLVLWTLWGPRRAAWSLVPLALGAEALSAQMAGWGRLAPGIPGGLAVGAALLGAALLGLGRERDTPATGG